QFLRGRMIYARAPCLNLPRMLRKLFLILRRPRGDLSSNCLLIGVMRLIVSQSDNMCDKRRTENTCIRRELLVGRHNKSLISGSTTAFPTAQTSNIRDVPRVQNP